ncbi:MAG: thylakoid membrane photosystem I accumulation factor [Cyanobacteria bacterium P01_D01_bin.105]
MTRLLRSVCLALVSVLTLAGLLWSFSAGPALAGLEDDNYDGNIFALYAGNGSIVPPRYSLAQSFQQDKPTLLFFYVDDSRDSKRFASVVSQLQAPYGRAANFIAISADSIPAKTSYNTSEPGYYFKGAVPQTVVFTADNAVVLDEVGQVSYELIDDKLREVFDLLPRTESVELKRRPINEVNSELIAD